MMETKWRAKKAFLLNVTKIRVASIQLLPTARKEQNLQKLQELIAQAMQTGAKLILLPEFSTTFAPNGQDDFLKFAEEIPGPSTDLMSKCANDHRVYMVGGSLIEKDPSGKLDNTCLVFDRQGQMMFRKIHPFKIDQPGPSCSKPD